MIKAEKKGIKYIAKSTSHECNPKNQASDYYLGIYNEEDNKVYMVKLSTAYQFN